MVLETLPYVVGTVPTVRYRCQDCDRILTVSTGHANRDDMSNAHANRQPFRYRLKRGFLKMIHASVWESHPETCLDLRHASDRDMSHPGTVSIRDGGTASRTETNEDCGSGLETRTRSTDSNED